MTDHSPAALRVVRGGVAPAARPRGEAPALLLPAALGYRVDGGRR